MTDSLSKQLPDPSGDPAPEEAYRLTFTIGTDGELVKYSKCA